MDLRQLPMRRWLCGARATTSRRQVNGQRSRRDGEPDVELVSVKIGK